MQSAPPELSHTATLEQLTPVPSSTSQHGLQQLQEHASGTPSSSEESDRGSADLPDDTDAVSVESVDTHRGRSTDIGWMNSRDNSSQEGSPGSRIDEYERSYANMRKPSDEMLFQIIPSAKERKGAVSVQELPNGTCFIMILNHNAN